MNVGVESEARVRKAKCRWKLGIFVRVDEAWTRLLLTNTSTLNSSKPIRPVHHEPTLYYVIAG